MRGSHDDLDDLRRRIEMVDLTDDTTLAADLLRELRSAHQQLDDANAEIRAQHEQIAGLLEGYDVLRSQHERMFATLPLPLMTTDPTGAVRSANAAAASLVGSRPGRMVGTGALALVAPGDRADLRAALDALGDRETPYRRLVTVLQHGPDLLDVEVTLTVLPGHPRAVAWLLRRPGEPEPPSVAIAAIPEILARLAALPLTTGEVRSALADAAVLIADGLGHEIAVSISLGSPIDPTVVTSSSARAQEIDGAQVAAGEGPSTTAYTTAITVESDDMANDQRWPRLATHLPASGSAVAVPLTFGGRAIGTLSVYCRLSDLDVGLVEACDLLGATVASVAYELGAKAELATLARDLEQAMESRAVIEQAKGVIMAVRRCDAEHAFEHLVALSSRRHVKLRDLAHRLVDEIDQE